MANFTPKQVADQCRISGPDLAGLPRGVDGAQLLWAMAGNESSFGVNCTPRHEPAFDVGGVYGSSPAMVSLLAKFGTAAACSYGPLQMMFCNAAPGTKPSDFDDIQTAFRLSVDFLNRQLKHWRPSSLEDIGEMWNAGRPLINPSPGVRAYTRRLAENYAKPLPLL